MSCGPLDNAGRHEILFCCFEESCRIYLPINTGKCRAFTHNLVRTEGHGQKRRKSARETLKPFDDDTNLLQVVIETPKGSRNISSSRIAVFLPSHVSPAGAVFPFDFGLLRMQGEDGDPLDVLLFMDAPDISRLSRAIEIDWRDRSEQTEDGERRADDAGDCR